MKKSPLDACEEFCAKRGIIKFSGAYFNVQSAIITKNHALSYNTIYECLRDWKYKDLEEFYDNYKWCFPYFEYYSAINLNRDTYYWILYKKIEEVYKEIVKEI